MDYFFDDGEHEKKMIDEFFSFLLFKEFGDSVYEMIFCCPVCM